MPVNAIVVHYGLEAHIFSVGGLCETKTVHESVICRGCVPPLRVEVNSTGQEKGI